MPVFHDNELGSVTVRVIASARKYIARWKTDGLHITVPASASRVEFVRTLNEWKPKLLALKPKDVLRYSIGFKYEVEDWAVEIIAEPHIPAGHVSVKLVSSPGDAVDRYRILVPSSADFSSAEYTKFISNIIKDLAAASASTKLLAMARAEARRLGLDSRVKAFKVGRGLRRLGCCSESGEISLSCTLMLLPPALRRATITHELAHLTFFDHSSRFYALWDTYLGHSHTIDVEARRKIKLPLFR